MPVSDRPACHWRILANAGVALSVLLLLALNARLGWAQGSASGAVRPTSSSEEIIGVGKVATAVRIEDEITLDGYLDEPAWQLALPAGDFIQKLPRNGEPAMNRTEARFLYDDDNLYIGVLCFDSDPDQITINELTEDFDWQTDFVGVVLDTLRDRRSGFMFIANPAGARRDGQLANDGDSNFDWDGVWDVEVSRNGEGWIAEFRIPFKTLRFSDAPIQEWGLNLERPTRHLNEIATWTHIPVRYNVSRVSLAGTLTGLEDIRQGRNLKIKPFVAGGFTQARDRQDLGAGLVSDQDYDGGFDLKYGLTQTLTLDATYRTDFAQVEVDQQQVNLTRFNLFFPEKREFFLRECRDIRFRQRRQQQPGPVLQPPHRPVR